MKANHTATPWQVHIATTTRNGYDVESTKGVLIAYNLRDKANAAFIVRAVNAHDELVEALRTTTDFAYKLAMKAPDLNPEGDTILLRANRALAKADGGKGGES